jgi:ectoine hydroxylase-related dioxygenase (phytanoyl-CoA dioxygenase family)
MQHYFKYNDVLEKEKEKVEALDSFKRFGFVVLEDVIDSQRVEAIQDVYDEIAAYRLEKGLDAYQSHLMPHKWDDRIIEFAKLESIIKSTETLLGGTIDLLHTQITFKPPRDKGFSIHQDNYYSGAQPADGIIAVWLALDDADEENGSLIVYPNSHNEGIFPVKKNWFYFLKYAPKIIFQSLRESVGMDIGGYERISGVIERFTEVVVPSHLKPMSIDIKKGSIGFMHGNLIHSSGINRSENRFRRNLLMNFIRQGAKFNHGITSRRRAVNIYN